MEKSSSKTTQPIAVVKGLESQRKKDLEEDEQNGKNLSVRPKSHLVKREKAELKAIGSMSVVSIPTSNRHYELADSKSESEDSEHELEKSQSPEASPTTESFSQRLKKKMELSCSSESSTSDEADNMKINDFYRHMHHMLNQRS